MSQNLPKREKCSVIVISHDVCDFCKENMEAIQHVFMICSEILPLWNNLSIHIHRKTSNRVGFSVNNVLFGELPFIGCNKVNCQFYSSVPKQN